MRSSQRDKYRCAAQQRRETRVGGTFKVEGRSQKRISFHMKSYILNSTTMPYDWGRIGTNSIIYQLLRSSGCTGLKINEPFAELWMGNHPSAPSRTLMGKTIPEVNGGNDIPFLFKILSVNKPLSLQAHPDKATAELLHRQNPKEYKDSNHKPEMGLFITPTTILYGFREHNELVHNIEITPELEEAIGEEKFMAYKNKQNSESLKEMISAILLQPKDKINSLVTKFMCRNHNYSEKTENVIRKIYKFYPDDFGPFFPLLLNVVTGQPYEAMYIPSGTLHAYVSGELFEAMATSDNVVRAGMTPKYIDIDTLMKMVVFEPIKPHIIKPTQIKQGLVLWKPPIDEFMVGKIELNGKETVSFELDDAMIAIVQKGNVTINNQQAKTGQIVFVPKSKLSINVQAQENSIVIFTTSSSK